MRIKHSGIFLTILLIFSTTSRGAPGNDIVLSCESAQTTLDKKNCEDDATGTVYVFDGTVADVMENNYAKIKLSSGQYAKVRFKTNISEKLKKGLKIEFSGLFSFFGTGILFAHKIDNAELMSSN